MAPPWTYIHGLLLAPSQWILGLLAGRKSGRESRTHLSPWAGHSPQSLRSSYRGSFKAPLSLSPHFTQDRLAAQGFKRNFFSRNFSHTVAFMSSPAAISISTNFSEQCVLLAQAAPCLVLASLEFRSSMSVTCKGGLGSEVCQSLSLALIQVPRYLIM